MAAREVLPTAGIVGNEPGHALWIGLNEVECVGSQPLLNGGHAECVGQRASELIDQRRWRPRCSREAEHISYLQARQPQFTHAGHIRQHAGAVAGGDRERPDSPLSDVWQQGRDGAGQQVNLATHQIDHCRRGAAIGNMNDGCAGLCVEQFEHQVVDAACAGRTIKH